MPEAAMAPCLTASAAGPNEADLSGSSSAIWGFWPSFGGVVKASGGSAAASGKVFAAGVSASGVGAAGAATLGRGRGDGAAFNDGGGNCRGGAAAIECGKQDNQKGGETLHQENDQTGKSTLYVVATPIGNLQDITLRALEILRSVDVIAAEDTRNTTRLLNHFAIGAKLIAVHEHNEYQAAARLIEMLQSGKSVALVSDAGTPAVSDPGAYLVAKVREAGLRVVPIPGANAAITAFSAAGIIAPHFLFYGFLPHTSSERKRELAALKATPHTLVFYESPHRILASMADLREVLGGARTVTIARELTKVFETIHTCTLEEALDWLEADPNQQRGEFVLLVSGAEAAKEEGVGEEAQRILQLLLAEMPLKQAVKLAAEISGEKKNALYELALQLKKGEE